jgi:hypothetical protein
MTISSNPYRGFRFPREVIGDQRQLDAQLLQPVEGLVRISSIRHDRIIRRL